MTKSRLRILLVTGAVLLLASVAAPSVQAKHSWGSWHWERKTNPASITLYDSTSGDWKPIAALVASDWCHSEVLDTPYTAQIGATEAERLACAPKEKMIRACNAHNPDVAWLGLATVYPSDLQFKHIAMATAQVNDFWFMGGPQDALVEEPAGPDAKRHVLCQEVGHTLGLDHQNARSCMDDENGLNDPAYMSPNAHDYEQLKKIYTHLDGVDSGGGGNGKVKRQTREHNGKGPEKRTDGYHGEGPHHRGHTDWYIGEENGRRFVRYIIWAH